MKPFQGSTLLPNQSFRSYLLAAGLWAFSSGLCAEYLAEARQYFNDGRYGEAVIQLKNALQENQEDAEARLLLGLVYLEKGDLVDAEKELEQAQSLGISVERVGLPLARARLQLGKVDQLIANLDVDAWSEPESKSEALALLGHAHIAKKELLEGRLLLKQALAHHQGAYALLGLARIAILEGRLEEGLAGIDEVLRIKPGYVEALYSKGQVLASQDKMPEALGIFSEILQKNERHIAARLARAEIYMRSQELDNARADAQAVLALQEMQPQAHFVMARLQLDAGEYEAAQVSAEKVLRFVPNHALSFFILGAAHYAQDNMEQAKFYLEKFIARQPSHLTAARILGATYLKLGDPVNTVKLLEPLDAGQAHQDAQLLNVLGRAYLKTGEFDKGTSALSRAMEIMPEIQGARAQMAIGHLAAGDTEQAIAQLEQTVKQSDNDPMASVMLILSYLKQQDFDKANREITASLKRFPKSGNFHNLKGLTLEYQQKLPQAREAYQQALVVDSDYVPALLSLAKLDIRKGDLTAARANYQRALEINPAQLNAMLGMAQLASMENDSQGLLNWLQQARSENTHAIQPVILLVNYYLERNNADKALNEALKFQTDHPNNTQIWSLLSRVHLAKGDSDQAKYHLQKVISQNAGDIEHRILLARVLASEKQHAASLEQVNEVLGIDQTMLPALALKSRLLIADRRFDDAAAVIKSISENHPASFLTKQLQGDLLAAQNQSEQALVFYENAFEQNKSSYLVNVLFEQYRAKGELALATEKLTQYLSEVPNDNATRFRLAATYQQLDMRSQAIAQYERLYDQMPENAILLNNLAWLYWIEKDERSLDYAQQAHQSAPDNPEIADTLGWVMLHEGDTAKALNILQQAASRAPTNPEIRYHLAVALSKNDQKDEAAKELKRLLRDYGNFPQAESAKSLLEELQP